MRLGFRFNNHHIYLLIKRNSKLILLLLNIVGEIIGKKRLRAKKAMSRRGKFFSKLK
jgi:hypothetical protein